MDRSILDRLLGCQDIPGTDEQLKALATRVSELANLNGPQWVFENRRELLRQWRVALGLEKIDSCK